LASASASHAFSSGVTRQPSPFRVSARFPIWRIAYAGQRDIARLPRRRPQAHKMRTRAPSADPPAPSGHPCRPGAGHTRPALATRRITAPRSVVVITSQQVVRGRAKRPMSVGKVVVLYRVGLHGMAHGHGRCTGHARITDKPARPARAGLLVTARARAGAAGANVRVTIVDAVTIATRHLERGEHDARGYRGHAARHRT
jgi:hypothetical protein